MILFRDTDLHEGPTNSLCHIVPIQFIVLCFFLNHRKSVVEGIPKWVWHLISFSEKFFEVLERCLSCRGIGMRPGWLYIPVVALSCSGSPRNIGLRHFLWTSVCSLSELWTFIKVLQISLDSNCCAWTLPLDWTVGNERWRGQAVQSQCMQIRRGMKETCSGEFHIFSALLLMSLPVDGMGLRKFWVVTVTGPG